MTRDKDATTSLPAVLSSKYYLPGSKNMDKESTDYGNNVAANVNEEGKFRNWKCVRGCISVSDVMTRKGVKNAGIA
jgi:hypothetical protein